MFVPLTVGLMEMGPVLSRQAVAITASLLVSLTAVLLTTGLLGRWLLPALPLDETPEDGNSQKTPVKRPSGAKALVDSADVMRELKPPSPSESSFFAACANQTTEAGQ
jgi:hypothetical protein